MREIVFRGEWTETGDWVKGFYVRLYDSTGHESHRIYPGYAETDCGAYYPDWYEVDPETVGQFTGLTDKNGKKIFEGDIVHVHDRLLQCSKPYHEFDGAIAHRDGSFVIVGEIMTHYRWLDYDVTVLGNIHDNPELLEG